ncbi:MAG: hypothetical protein JWM01_1762 [Arthrobacter sp.]|nr:hypothetical protein [Arthrobacter sp.]
MFPDWRASLHGAVLQQCFPLTHQHNWFPDVPVGSSSKVLASIWWDSRMV